MRKNKHFGFEHFPWGELREYSPAEVHEQARALGHVEAHREWAESLGFACEDKLKQRFTLRIDRVDVSDRLRAPTGFVELSLSLSVGPDEAGRVAVYVQNSLATRMLKAAYPDVNVSGNDDQPLNESNVKRLKWLVPSIVRRLGVPWKLGADLPEGPFALVTAQAVFYNETFQVLLFAPLPAEHRARPLTRATLSELGALPLSLPVVASVAGATDDDLAALEPGAAWAPGEATFTLRRDEGGAFRGSALLVAPSAELGPEAHVEEDGTFRVRSLRAPCPWDASFYQEGDDQEGDGEGPGLHVVRVELGRITMSAREWAALGPGASLPAPRGERALLRVGGAIVARGRLDRIGGELAVRIEKTA